MLTKIGQSWRCPFCGHYQVLSDELMHTTDTSLWANRNRHRARRAAVLMIECSNPECREFAAWLSLHDYKKRPNGTIDTSESGEQVMTYQLRPASIAKPQHSSVPAPLVKDYEEACAIVGASPKAAATLARRCLQGMIRNFCEISCKTLHGEITELRKQVEDGTAPRQVSEESIAAIDAVREVGNIGAHFEADINLIVDVDPEEATALIGLIELLFEEWYVARYERQQRLAAVKSVAGAKKEAKQSQAAESSSSMTAVDKTTSE